MSDLPAGYAYGYVVARLVDAKSDGPDSNALPDAEGVVGAKVVFRPLQTSKVSTPGLPEPSTLAIHRDVVCSVALDGQLIDDQKQPGVWLYTGSWVVSVIGGSTGVQPFTIVVEATHTKDAPLDLWAQVPYQPRPGDVVRTLALPSVGRSGDVLVKSDDGVTWSGSRVVSPDDMQAVLSARLNDYATKADLARAAQGAVSAEQVEKAATAAAKVEAEKAAAVVKAEAEKTAATLAKAEAEKAAAAAKAEAARVEAAAKAETEKAAAAAQESISALSKETTAKLAKTADAAATEAEQAAERAKLEAVQAATVASLVSRPVHVPVFEPALQSGYTGRVQCWREGDQVFVEVERLASKGDWEQLGFTLPAGMRPDAWVERHLPARGITDNPVATLKMAFSPRWDNTGEVRFTLKQPGVADGRCSFPVAEPVPGPEALRAKSPRLAIDFRTAAGFAQVTPLRGWGGGTYGNSINSAAEDTWYYAEQVTRTDMGMRLRVLPDTSPSAPMPYRGAYASLADTHHDLTGPLYMETVAYVPPELGTSFAWWNLPWIESGEPPWPPEEDIAEIFEINGVNRYTFNVHTPAQGSTPVGQLGSKTYGPSPAGWHTIGCERRGAAYKIYVDGILYGSWTASMDVSTWPLYPIWSMGCFKNKRPGDQSSYVRSFTVWDLS